MIFHATTLPGVVLIALEPNVDERGSFARIFCTAELDRQGLRFTPVQASLSRNPRRGTLRGLHYQRPPAEETKLVQVLAGAAWDVVVDLRPESATRGRWLGVRLDPSGACGLVIPPGCAHGFLTIEPGTDLLYHMDRAYEPAHAWGVRWDDPVLAITWPAEPDLIGERDRLWPDLAPNAASW